MASPDNLFEKNIGLISNEKLIMPDKNLNNIIQGKKIDFTDDIIFNENEPFKNQTGNIIINNINNINNQNINYKQNISLSNKKIINHTYNNVNSLPNNININNNSTLRPKCTCSKTGCLKKYCACFAKGIKCQDCECKNCENKTDKKDNIEIKEKKVFPLFPNPINNNNNQRAICNCTKSNCMKKYCECFKQGFSCNSLCRCMDCQNKIELNNINNNNDINTPEFRDFSGAFFPNNENINEDNKIDFRLPCNYQTEAFGINIRKENLKMDMRETNLNDISSLIHLKNNYGLNATPKFSKRKRLRGKSDSANLKTAPTTNSENKKGRSLSSGLNKNIQKKKLNLN